ncbi:MAG: hypothetical protein AAB345_00350 [Patescibacteria group bacterium]
MNTLLILSAMCAILAYIPLWVHLPSGKVKQNLLTWILWGSLEVIMTAAIVAQKGNFLLPAAYFLGTVVTIYLIFRAQKGVRSDARVGAPIPFGRLGWTWFESIVTALVIACMIIWYFAGSKVATIAGTFAMLFAGIPQLIDVWRCPREMPLLTALLYLSANSLSSAGGKDWSIQERFYPTCAVFYSLATIIFILRRYRTASTPAPA